MTTLTLSPTRDTYVDEFNQGTAPGTATLLSLGNTQPSGGGLFSNWVLAQFDTSTIPAGAVITEAKLRLFSYESSPSWEFNAWAEPNTATWAETTTNWSNKPTTTGVKHGEATVPNVVGGWVEFTITALVTDWYSGALANHGLTLATDKAVGAIRRFRSREYGSDVPQLVVTYYVPPSAPTELSPVGSVDRTQPQVFSYKFNSPDSTDYQSKRDWRYRLVGAQAWTTVTTTTLQTQFTVAAGTFPLGDYEYQIRTYNSQGQVGPWSASAFFTAADTPNAPLITSPASGATIAESSTSVAWSTPDQDAYQIRRVADNAGAPDTLTVYSDTGEVASATARSASVAFPVNGRWEHVQVRTKVNGLWSDWASHRVNVSYTAPLQPTAYVSAQGSHLAIYATHPAPTTQPRVTHMHIWRTDGETTIRVAKDLPPTATFLDYRVAHAVDYSYRVEAVGDNNTSTLSEPAGEVSVETVTYGGGY